MNKRLNQTAVIKKANSNVICRMDSDQKHCDTKKTEKKHYLWSLKFMRKALVYVKSCGKLHPVNSRRLASIFFNSWNTFRPQYSKDKWCNCNYVFHRLKCLVKKKIAGLAELQEQRVVGSVIADIEIIDIGKSNLKNEIIVLDINTIKKTCNNLIGIEENDEKINY